MISNLRRRADDAECPNGGIFYSCGGAFRGCCLINPCGPGNTCPADKDTTPGRSSDANSQPSSASYSTTRTVFPATFSTSASTTISAYASTSATSSADDNFTLSPVRPESTAFRTVTQSPSATTTPPGAAALAPVNYAHSAPIAAIVGAVLGFIILITLGLFIFLCIRKKRQTKVYKALAYPSSLVGSDMTPQLSSKASSQLQQKVAALYRVDTVAERHNPLQLDSREIGRHENRSHRSISRYAELPAGPMPWQGNSGGN